MSSRTLGRRALASLPSFGGAVSKTLTTAFRVAFDQLDDFRVRYRCQTCANVGSVGKPGEKTGWTSKDTRPRSLRMIFRSSSIASFFVMLAQGPRIRDRRRRFSVPSETRTYTLK